jgi:hypothetical protein
VPTVNWPQALQGIKAAAAECDQFLTTLNLQHLKETLQQQNRDFEKALHELCQNGSQQAQILNWVSNIPNWEDHELVRRRTSLVDPLNGSFWRLLFNLLNVTLIY